MPENGRQVMSQGLLIFSMGFSAVLLQRRYDLLQAEIGDRYNGNDFFHSSFLPFFLPLFLSFFLACLLSFFPQSLSFSLSLFVCLCLCLCVCLTVPVCGCASVFVFVFEGTYPFWKGHWQSGSRFRLAVPQRRFLQLVLGGTWCFCCFFLTWVCRALRVPPCFGESKGNQGKKEAFWG